MSKNKDLLELLDWVEGGCDYYEEKLLNAKNQLIVDETYCDENEQEIVEREKKRVNKYKNKLEAYKEVEKYIKEMVKRDRKKK